MFSVNFFATLCLAVLAKGISDTEKIINIELDIQDNGQETQYTIKQKNGTNIKFSTDRDNLGINDKESHRNSNMSITKYNDVNIKNQMELKNDSTHVQKDEVNVLGDTRQQISDDFHPQVDKTSKIYEEFINSTQKHKVKTPYGFQKVIINTTDSFNKILRRLANYFLTDVGISELKAKEYQNICNDNNICRTNKVFADFLIEFIDEVLNNDDKAPKAFHGLTEVLKYKNFKFMDEESQQLFKAKLIATENWPPDQVISFLIMAKTIIQHRHKNPTLKATEFDVDLNKTLIMLEIIDILDQNILPNEENQRAWKNLKTDIQDWNNDKRHDILRIMQNFVFHIGKGIFLLKPETKRDFSMKCKQLFATYDLPE